MLLRRGSAGAVAHASAVCGPTPSTIARPRSPTSSTSCRSEARSPLTSTAPAPTCASREPGPNRGSNSVADPAAYVVVPSPSASATKPVPSAGTRASAASRSSARSAGRSAQSAATAYDGQRRRASSAAWTRLALRSPVTPSGRVAQPSAAARAANAASSVTTITSATRLAARAAATVSRANAVARRGALLVGQPGQPGLAEGGRLDGHQDGEADGGVGRGGHRGDPPIRASARGNDPESDLPVACCRRTAAPGPRAEE